MKNKDLIQIGLNSFDTMVVFIKKKIDFEDLSPRKFKSVVDGKKKSFEGAQRQLTRVKQIQEAESCWKESEHKTKLSQLVDAAEDMEGEIKKILEAAIEEEDYEDDHVGTIIDSKENAFDLLANIIQVRKDMKRKIKDSTSLSGSGNRNFATSRVKDKS